MQRTRILLACTLLLVAAGVVAGLVALAVTPADFEEDFTPPIITDVSPNSVTHNSAVISWTTDEPATTQAIYFTREHTDDGMVHYGDFGSVGEVNSWGGKPPLSRSHSVGIGSQEHPLEPDTTYTYEVASVDAAGNGASSDEYTFTTLPLP